MPEINSKFTNREVLDALRKAGWDHLLPHAEELDNPDDICVEFTSALMNEDDEDDEDDEESDDDSAEVSPKKIQQVWDSLDD